MKKIILTLILLLTISTLVGCIETNSNQPETIIVETNYYSGTCPTGLTNDTYPGECGQYIDTDNNKICDRSE
ncbi:MAG: hypothetical protein KAQ83_02610 [Nanoarchaeota archaeon]|nr:hypothetical protein [Nanoarchaeota archaeon]